MIRKTFVVAAACAFMVSTANATTANPTASLVAPAMVNGGDQFQVDMFIDFGSLGLGSFSALMEYNPDVASVVPGSTIFNPALAIDDTISCPGATFFACIDDPVTGTFELAMLPSGSDLIAAGGPDSNNVLVLSLLLQAANVSIPTTLSLSLSQDYVFGLFATADGVPLPNSDPFIPLTLLGADITINPAVVPVPAAVWLMIGGLGALFRFRRS